MFRPIISWKELQPKYLLKIPIFEFWITLHKCTQPVIFNLPVHCSPELDALTGDETFDEGVLTVLYFLSECFYSCLTLWSVSFSWCWLETFYIVSEYIMWLLSVPLTCRLLLCETKNIKYYNITILQPSEPYLCGYKSSYMRIPYRMKMYTKLNFMNWLKKVKIWNRISADLQLSILYNMIER